MTKKGIFIVVSLLLPMLFLSIDTAQAVPNPDIIQWRAAPEAFVTSLYQGIFGRNPENNNVVQGHARQVTSSPQSRYDLFWKFVGSAEYQNSMWARHPKEYGVWWNTRMIDSPTGRRVCHCYYSSKDSHGGYMPSMQYTGVPYPAGKFSFGVSRALARMYAAFDRETCPHYDCGYSGGGVSSGSGNASSSTANLVQQGTFAGFGQHGGPWGTGLYSNYGIWWNSRNARASARAINLNTSDTLYINNGIRTALHIQNSSSRTPHVFGTTSQRIRVAPGRVYRITLWAAAKGLNSNGGVNITIDPQWRIRPIRLRGGSYNWTKYSGTFTADNSGYIDLRIISEDRGDVLLTGLEMQLEGQQAAQGGGRLPAGSKCSEPYQCASGICLLGVCAQ